MAKTYERDVVVELTTDDIANYGKRSAALEKERKVHDAELKTYSKTKKGRISEIDDEIDRIAEAIDTQRDTVSMLVSERLNKSDGMIDIFRVDTGELVDRRTVGKNDLQLNLDDN